MTKEEIEELLERQEYKFAKTMPKHPHSYTLRYNWSSQEQFEEVVQFIRDNCTIEYFYGKPYQMYYLNGYKYWTMGNPMHITKLINKAKI